MTELLVLGGVGAFGVYAFVSMRGASRADGDAAEALRAFAELRGLREEPEHGPEPVREVTWGGLLRRLVPVPAEMAPARGATCYAGAVDGLPLHLSPLLVRRRFVDLRDPWTRLAVELPRVPASLRVRPRTRWDSLVRALLRSPRPTGDAAFDRAFVQRGDGRDWLTAERRSALLDASRRLGRVEIAGGRLCLLHRGQPPALAELDRLASELLAAAQRIVAQVGRAADR